MTSLKKNITANISGQIWANALGFMLTPFYLMFLGVEAYGLVGFHISLQSIISLMDLGMGTSLNRETARYSARSDGAQGQKDLVRTIEVICWGIAIIVMILVQGLSVFIAKYWLNPQGLSDHTVQNAVWLMGISIAFTFPMNLYRSGLIGLQRIVSVNVVLMIYATIRSLGTILVLWLYSPTIEAFFVWQAISNILGTAMMALCLWHYLRASDIKARFRLDLLRDVWRFSLGYLGNSIANAAFAQTDKIIISKLLPLKLFGYYMLAQTVANAIWFLVSPVTGALFPRFSQLAEKKNEKVLVETYHKACQMVSVLVIPAALMMVFFSWEAMAAWTRNYIVAKNTQTLIGILATGVMLRALSNVPSWLRLAYGWFELALYTNILLLCILFSSVYAVVTHYGLLGAAVLQACLTACHIFTVPPTHSRLIKKEFKPWLVYDIGLPFIVSTAIILTAYQFTIPPKGIISAPAYLVTVWLLAMGGAALASDKVRAVFTGRIRQASNFIST